MKNLVFLFALLTLMSCRESSETAPVGSSKAGLAVEDLAVNEDEFKITLTPRAVDSDERKTIAAFDKAKNIEIISLKPWFESDYFNSDKPEPPAGLSQKEVVLFNFRQQKRDLRAIREWCSGNGCIDSNRILGRISINKSEQRDFLARTIRGWLESAPDVLTACIPAFHHAIAFESEGRKYVLLLCYGCGQYQIIVDGKNLGAAENGGIMNGDIEMNRLFKEAGIKFHQDTI